MGGGGDAEQEDEVLTYSPVSTWNVIQTGPEIEARCPSDDL